MGVDTWKKAGNGNGFTFSSASPLKRIDYIWISKIRPVKAWIPKTNASDHLPVMAELSIE